MNLGFESFVNSEECKTYPCKHSNPYGLRALLIQKSVKLSSSVSPFLRV